MKMDTITVATMRNHVQLIVLQLIQGYDISGGIVYVVKIELVLFLYQMLVQLVMSRTRRLLRVYVKRLEKREAGRNVNDDCILLALYT